MWICTFVRFETMIWPSIRFDKLKYRTLKIVQTFSDRKKKEYVLIPKNI